jgi:hypothetical protein
MCRRAAIVIGLIDHGVQLGFPDSPKLVQAPRGTTNAGCTVNRAQHPVHTGPLGAYTRQTHTHTYIHKHTHASIHPHHTT